MRSRLAVAFVVLGILLIGCFAGVRAVELRDLVRGLEAQHVAEQADQVAAAVVLVEQPYRVAGRRVPPRAPVLDAAWLDVVGAVLTVHGDGDLHRVPLC